MRVVTLLSLALAAVADPNVLVFATNNFPFQLTQWNPQSNQTTNVSQGFPNYVAADQLSAIDRRRNIYYNLVYEDVTSQTILTGISTTSGQLVVSLVLDFAQLLIVGLGQGLCVNHATGQVYVSGLMNTSDFGWFLVDPATKTTKLIATEPTAGTVSVLGAPTTYDSKRNVIWTQLSFNGANGSVSTDLLTVAVQSGVVTRIATPVDRVVSSLSYDDTSDLLYATYFYTVQRQSIYMIATFSPSTNYANWRTVTTRGYQPDTPMDAFAHAPNASPILYALAKKAKATGTAETFYLVGFNASSGAVLHEKVACNELIACPWTLEAVQA